jgi:tRNA threonylcarbamoyl adenosine modification protein YeaZ
MSGERSWLLALDTSTTTGVVAAGSMAGELLVSDAFEGRYRHSQELLPAVVRMIDGVELHLSSLVGVVVGTGPGAFTGLRVGIATAKTLAHELGCPIVGIPSSAALLATIEGAGLLWLPSGPRDRVAVVTGGDPVIVPGAEPGPPPAAGMVELAIDLDGRASDASNSAFPFVGLPKVK